MGSVPSEEGAVERQGEEAGAGECAEGGPGGAGPEGRGTDAGGREQEGGGPQECPAQCGGGAVGFAGGVAVAAAGAGGVGDEHLAGVVLVADAVAGEHGHDARSRRVGSGWVSAAARSPCRATWVSMAARTLSWISPALWRPYRSVRCWVAAWITSDTDSSITTRRPFGC